MIFIPWVAAGAGSSLIVWSTKMIYHNDNSADQQVAKFIRNLPEYVR